MRSKEHSDSDSFRFFLFTPGEEQKTLFPSTSSENRQKKLLIPAKQPCISEIKRENRPENRHILSKNRH